MVKQLEVDWKTLLFVSCHLATLDKVRNESNKNVTYETVNQLEYLNAVVKEALRLFSASILEKTYNRAFKLPPALRGKKPFTVYKGMNI